MERFTKYFLPSITLIVLILWVIPGFEKIGKLLLFFLTPISLVSVLLSYKDKVFQNDLKLKPYFLFSLNVTVLSIVLYTLFRIQHYPGGYLFKLFGFFSLIISIGIGGVYVLRNRKHLNQTFTAEVVLMFFPAIMFLYHLTPLQKGVQDKESYRAEVIHNTFQLAEVVVSIADTNCLVDEIEEIEKIKWEIIKRSGGYNEDGSTMYEFYNPDAWVLVLMGEKGLVSDKFPFLKEYEYRFIRISYSGEAIFILTQIQLDVLTQKCYKNNLKYRELSFD